MRRDAFSLRFFIAALVVGMVRTAVAEDGAASEEARLLTNVRQLTFEGKRAGEGYFSADGSKIVFQSERQDDNPFYQIYLMDMETGDVARVSPGFGKTTCAWVHPTERKVMFASTHDDPEARAKQKAELDFRASGQTRRYSWDYDEHFEIYAADFKGEHVQRLTNAVGYDAEGSYSPDGKWIAFASNRAAYSDPPTGKDAELFETDKSFLMDIYIMRADGSDVKRLTDVKGYDGGPFFSPDGKKIVWRRFAENGVTAEVYSMNADGTDQRQITKIGAMSWAPYYHASMDYIIFATNKHGFDNFELYMVDAQGAREPVRVTYTPGFDGLPVFSPDGKHLAWTSNRTSTGSSQLFFAEWNDAAARELLSSGGERAGSDRVLLANEPDIAKTTAPITVDDLRTHITYLASEQMEGRRTGTIGEMRAATYIADVMAHLGLKPAGDDETYFQHFEFTAGVSLGPENRLALTGGEKPVEFAPKQNWQPLTFSKTGQIPASEIVFAGYGIKAPKGENAPEYDSFVHLDVTDKWVMVFRFMPEGITPEMRQHLNTHSSLRYKASTVRDMGARGLIVVSGPNSKVKEQLVPMVFDVSIGSTSVAAISITDAVAEQMLASAGESLKDIQDSLDTGEMMMGIPLEKLRLEASIDIQQEKQIARNVVGRMYAGDAQGDTAVAVGAHFDHLGIGRGSGSLARDDESDKIHYGADDNASGVAGTLEIAQYLADLKQRGEVELKHDVLFCLWSGEELSTLGSQHFVDTYAGKGESESLQPEITAYLNMDMIGRLKEKVVIQGVDSSSIWAGEIEQRNAPVGLSISAQYQSGLPTDSTSFYLKRVPSLNAFTGAHEDYHSPRDTADKINYEGAQKITRFMGLVTRAIATREDAPDFVEAKQPENMEVRANLQAYLGTIPDYVEAEIPGLKLSGVTKGAPAEAAGMRMGDIIVKIAGTKIENIYDYTFAIEAMKVGVPVDVVVVREGKELTLTVTPSSRQ